MPVSPWAQLRWCWDTLNKVFSWFGSELIRTNGGLGYLWPQLFVVATVVGVVQLASMRRDLIPVLLGPAVVVLTAALLGLYPLSGRFWGCFGPMAAQ